MSLTVQDHYLNEQDHRALLDTVLGQGFPWYWNNTVTYRDSPSEDLDDYQFVHTLYDNFAPRSDYFSLIVPLLELLKPAALIRVKLNLNPRTAEPVRFPMHRDVNDHDCVTAVYYVNTNNGYTEFEDAQQVSSVANRLVTFPGSLRHAGVTCTDQKCRVIMNINYLV